MTVAPLSARRAALRYLEDRFPLGSLGLAVVAGYACSYLLYGAVRGDQVFGLATVAGAVSFTLLFFERRLIDDVEDLRAELTAGDEGRLRGLIRARTVVAGAVLVVSALAGWKLLLAAAGAVAWLPAAAVVRARIPEGLRFVVIETCPAVIFAYAYAAWWVASGRVAPAGAVVATVALFWTGYQFWNFTRKAGDPDWAPWDLSLPNVRRVLLGLLALALAAAGGCAAAADLPALAACGGALAVGFAAWVTRTWDRLPARDPVHGVRPGWAGLPLIAAVELGVLLGVSLSGAG